MKEMLVSSKHLKFAAKCRDVNRQYEINNNQELDNGVYNNFVQSIKDEEKDDDAEKGLPDSLMGSKNDGAMKSEDGEVENQIEEAQSKGIVETELEKMEHEMRTEENE
jgi:hypothetical protein